MLSAAETAEVLAFWFEQDIVPGLCEYRPIWFDDPDFDGEVRRRFLASYERVTAGELDGDLQSADQLLALTLVLDQLPRNMFRGTARQYATDAMALAVARQALDAGLDQAVPPIRRWFLYMPFQHSERLDDQRRSVALVRSLGPAPVFEQALRSALLHLEIIERFGRFPHRNALLNRQSSAAEREFLATLRHHHLGRA